ncbi:DUF4034 domain-containing protein [Dyella solisilvae]|uniref:DUF4034 domain-containing protein n=1 Tax=Dyella solisilvae TaxID=1920168 RepID=A0A370K6G1_9GAMM|nr:DUF4034 domain-containing protein [Dyella solisilvae]RDI98223.1 DUF4034 domain-containing protein [Dyella solisilvae]
MGSRRHWLQGGAIALFVVFGLVFATWQTGRFVRRMNEITVQSRAQAQAKEQQEYRLAGIKGRLFTRAEVYAFLKLAKQAESIADPMQRCLAYPDPPGSHWSRDAVVAYCRYRTQPLMTFSDVQSLVQHGQAAELDRRLQKLLDAKSTQPGAGALLDRTYDQLFKNGSLDARAIIDAWKRDSPKSAFAYAASGQVYEAMAYDARGSDYMRNTPQSNIASMERLLAMADEDLRKAIELDPRVTPAYVTMINVGGLSAGEAYATRAAKQGLAVDPANFHIYDALLWKFQPKWGGSLGAMTRIAQDAQAHAKENPLLILLLEKELGYEANLDDCDCHTKEQLGLYPTVFDQVSTAQQLMSAGYASESSHHLELSVVYFSEALRFSPDLDDVRLHRAFNLNEFDESQWAAHEGDKLLAGDPRNEAYYKARGYAYESLNDYAKAEKDYRAAIALAPNDETVWKQLGYLYVNMTHEWDKAWELDNHLIDMYPNEPYGWLMRSEIQLNQPRAGLKETVDYYASHFDTDPKAHKTLLRLQAALALQSKAGSKASEK